MKPPVKAADLLQNTDRPEYVPRFLSAQAKKVVLNNQEPSQNVLSILRTPVAGTQDYTVVEIDATAFKDGGVLTIDLWIGSAEAAGAFILFASDSELSVHGRYA